MLSKELRGQPYNKAEHNRALQQLLNNRSHGAIERKHQNISAILIEEGYPYIDGYKPLGNYQDLLRSVVEERLAGAMSLNAAVSAVVTQPSVNQSPLEDLLAIQIDPPVREENSLRINDRALGRRMPQRNYLEVEARNQTLGLAGEELALKFERQRLERIGASKLASQIQHVSRTEGDYFGYDILSFEPDGRERLIEVKTTQFGPMTPFFASRNEVEVSESRKDVYQLYRVFSFRKQPKLFALAGSLRRTCRLDPYTYSAGLW